ncbi:MAG: hypothetical protein K8I29_19335 [Alphaproteobacteria bacterium]|uniref:Uncharacterized protein n=1 Tax=Candidatus Nitrobium versatile TaxID=2884831 RepID=A0A953M3N6_9BACT|nr:hypothetical protein [Candidatus Nitrobium versatile]
MKDFTTPLTQNRGERSAELPPLYPGERKRADEAIRRKNERRFIISIPL